MLNKLRGFSNSKLAGVLIGIIIIPFVFWGMGSVFSGGNTNNLAKINNESISTQEFVQYVNQAKIDSEYIKKNIENNVIEEFLSSLISNKLLEMEIKNLNASISENTLINKIKNNRNFLDEKNVFSRIKYEKFLLENNLTAPDFEGRLKDQELKKNLFNYISGGINSPFFLKNKFFLNENKKLEISYIDLDKIYELDTSKEKIDEYISKNKSKLEEEIIDIKYSKITPTDLIEINEFNDEFFKKIDDIENSLLNGTNIETIKDKYNLKLISITDLKNHNDQDEIIKEIYNYKSKDKIGLIDKNDFYLLYEISNIKKLLPSINDYQFIEKVLKELIIDQKNIYNQELFKKIQEKKLNDVEFFKIAKNDDNIENITLETINSNEKFTVESIKLLYSLPVGSYSLIGDLDNKIYLTKINKINKNDLSKNSDNLNNYKVKSDRQLISEIYDSYDLSLGNKYKVKMFQNTIDRIKNNFR